MKEDFQTFLRSCVIVMLRPVAAFCIERGLRFQDFVDLAKKAFVASAENKLQTRKELVSISKLSVMTGIQRPEITRVFNKIERGSSKDFIARVIGQWSSDRRFMGNGQPKKLSISGIKSDFAKLVFSVGSDLNPHTVRFELKRLGLIEVKGEYAKLLSPIYTTEGDPQNTLRLGAKDVDDFLSTLQENAFGVQDIPNLQARTEYDNVPDEELDTIRRWFVEEGSQLHDRARKFLSKFDRDINSKKSKGFGRNRVVIGTYSRVEKLEGKLTEEN